jgi:hypothetical protein
MKAQEETLKYTLKRLNDGLINVGSKIGWIEWSDEGRGKEMHNEPAIGRSLMLDPHVVFNYTWLTTSITEIVEQREDYIKFATKNSVYELTAKK